MSATSAAAAEHAGAPVDLQVLAACGEDIAAWRRCSVEQPQQFWPLLWRACHVIGAAGQRVVAEPDQRWFPDAGLNLAQNLLRRRDLEAAICFWGEDKLIRRMGRGDLYRRVARLALAMREAGIEPGDHIAVRMPNIPETLITFLAAAAIGAVFVAVAPTLPAAAAVQRLAPLAPKLFFIADGRHEAGNRIDALAEAARIAAALPSLRQTVVARYIRREGHNIERINNAVMLRRFVDPFRWHTEIEFAVLGFDHPAAVTIASDTAAPVTHGLGGLLLQGVAAHRLHPGGQGGAKLLCLAGPDKAAWLRLAIALAADAALLLYDGDPGFDNGRLLFDYAVAEGATDLYLPASYLDACAASNTRPAAGRQLTTLRAIHISDGVPSPQGVASISNDIPPAVAITAIPESIASEAAADLNAGLPPPPVTAS